MIFDTLFCIAIRNELGKYNIQEFTLFEVEKINNKMSEIKINFNKNKEIIIKVKCSICEEYHYYNYNISDLKKVNVIIGGCKVFGSPIIFIGKLQDIKKHIETYEKTTKDVCVIL